MAFRDITFRNQGLNGPSAFSPDCCPCCNKSKGSRYNRQLQTLIYIIYIHIHHLPSVPARILQVIPFHPVPDPLSLCFWSIPTHADSFNWWLIAYLMNNRKGAIKFPLRWKTWALCEWYYGTVISISQLWNREVWFLLQSSNHSIWDKPLHAWFSPHSGTMESQKLKLNHGTNPFGVLLTELGRDATRKHSTYRWAILN